MLQSLGREQYKVMSSDGKAWYIVSYRAMGRIYCTCPYASSRKSDWCKHIAEVERWRRGQISK